MTIYLTKTEAEKVLDLLRKAMSDPATEADYHLMDRLCDKLKAEK